MQTVTGKSSTGIPTQDPSVSNTPDATEMTSMYLTPITQPPVVHEEPGLTSEEGPPCLQLETPPSEHGNPFLRYIDRLL